MAKPKTNSPKKAAQIFEQVMKLSVSGNPKPIAKNKNHITMKDEEYITVRLLKLIGFEHVGNGVMQRGKDKIRFDKVLKSIIAPIDAELHNGLTLADLAKEIKAKI